MNVFLWALQALLAVHTVMGALWKFVNPEETVPSLASIPHGVWLGIGGIEIACAVGLIVPALKRNLGALAPVAALLLVAEMAMFTVVHLNSGDPAYGPVIYWLVVAAVCAFIAYGRFVLKPLGTATVHTTTAL